MSKKDKSQEVKKEDKPVILSDEAKKIYKHVTKKIHFNEESEADKLANRLFKFSLSHIK